MAEEGNIIVVIIGYLLAILFPIFGLLFGIILYFMKNKNQYYVRHAKYIIIVAVFIMAISIIIASMMGLAMVP